MTEEGETTDPRIYIVVERKIKGQVIRNQLEVGLYSWIDGYTRGKFGSFIDSEISALLKSIHFPDQGIGW